MMAALARPPREDAYRRFWINGFADPVEFDQAFCQRALSVAARRRAETIEPDWFSGVSKGAVTGTLRAIDDLQGDRLFVIVPNTGPDQIECRFPESMRNQIGAYAFKPVRVSGLLTYHASSPFPVQVEMEEINEVPTPSVHLLDLEGLFAG